MASPNNPQQQQQQQFDMHKLFLPSSSSSSSLNPNPPLPNPIINPNPNLQIPSSSYPPPTAPPHHSPFPFSYPYPHHQHHLPPQQLHQHHPQLLPHMHSSPSPSPSLQPSPPPPNPLPLLDPNPNSNPNLFAQVPQRSLSFPTPALHPSSPRFSPDRSGAEIMALLRPPSSSPAAPPFHSDPPTMPPVVGLGVAPAIVRMPSSTAAKLPRGRKLPTGDHNLIVTYDVDVRLPGEVQPQLEVTPITKYATDPQLCLGRQIAVNKCYICYGLKQGNIRILNINTALRSLFRTQSQRVNDMAFFAEDVHLLASAGIDGRITVWKISEGPDEEDKPQISGKAVIAVQVVGEGEIKNPRVCWHCYKQEILVVGVGKSVLKIDTNKVGKSEAYAPETPLQCPIDKLVEGIQLVGKHEGEVTDLSMCQWMTTRLVSASTDGTIKIWEDHKAVPLVLLRPYDGQPVHSATFLTAPDRPDHIVLITAGPQNREVKVWVSASEEGWLLPSDSDSLSCTQTLELKSSSEPSVEEAFFNQVVALPHVGLLLLANAKKNAIYVVHIDFGPNPAATRMDYISEFTVTMPILSLTGTSDILHGQSVAQIYCVQTQAIQQYTLDLCQCLPPLVDNLGLEKSDYPVTRDVAANAEGLSYLESHGSKISDSAASVLVAAVAVQHTPSSIESKPVTLTSSMNDAEVACHPSSPHPQRPLADNAVDQASNQPVIEYSVDQNTNTISANFSDVSSLDGEAGNIDKKIPQKENSGKLNPPVTFKHPTHLITPSEIFMGSASSETAGGDESKGVVEQNIQDVVANGDVGSSEVEVKEVDETKSTEIADLGLREESRNVISESKEKFFCSQASGLGIEMAKECSAISAKTYAVQEPRLIDDTGLTDSFSQASHMVGEVDDQINGVSGKVSGLSMPTLPLQSATPGLKGKKQKGKSSQVSVPSSPSQSAFNSTDSFNEPSGMEVAFPQILSMQEMISQLLNSQKEMQKQMSNLVAVPVSKECKRLEASLGRSMEKAIKANTDALWARFQEENAKSEKLLRDRTQQITTLLTNFVNKDLPAMLEKAVKKELGSVGSTLVRTQSPVIEKMITTAITESFQRGVGDKAVNQLEKSVNSKLEASVARQIQAQFQTSGKQALQDALKTGLEASLIPAFEMSCKAMFEQVDATFQKGLIEHTTAAQQHFESSNSQLALTLREAINSASVLTQTLSGELADNQRKLVALAAAGANSPVGANPLVMQLSNGPLAHEKVEAHLDPTKELSRLISEHKFEEAFISALQRSDVSIVSWLCSQVDLHDILTLNPLPLSQGVLLSLLQQLACDVNKDTPGKLAWMTDVASAINPADQMIAVHIRAIFDQVYQILVHLRTSPSISGSEHMSIRILLHVITSVLTTCK